MTSPHTLHQSLFYETSDFSAVAPATGKVQTALNPSPAAEIVNLIFKYTDGRFGQRISAHDQQGGRVDVQGDQIPAVGLEIAELVDVGILAAAAMTGGQFAAAGGIHMTRGGAVEQGFGGGALEDTDTATAGAVIVDGAALAVSPAENQGVVRGASSHQVSAVGFGTEPGEFGDVGPVNLKFAQPQIEPPERNAAVILVHLGKKFVESHRRPAFPSPAHRIQMIWMMILANQLRHKYRH